MRPQVVIYRSYLQARSVSAECELELILAVIEGEDAISSLVIYPTVTLSAAAC